MKILGRCDFSDWKINLKNTFAICDIGFHVRESGVVEAGGNGGGSSIEGRGLRDTLASRPGSVVSLRGFIRACKSNLSSLEPVSRRHNSRHPSITPHLRRILPPTAAKRQPLRPPSLHRTPQSADRQSAAENPPRRRFQTCAPRPLFWGWGWRVIMEVGPHPLLNQYPCRWRVPQHCFGALPLVLVQSL